ncbi:MAG: hypothetical protein O2968_06880 [Acidobacteria bacterium]|nr:hypothetical protein [Acidobacteriota bacterium]
MQNETQLLQIMTVFTGIAAVALLIQMAAMIGVWFSIKKARQRVSDFLDRWEPLAETANSTLQDVRRESNEILKQVREITVLAKNQVEKADQALDEISKTTHLQAQRVDQTVQLLLDRVQESAAALQQAVLAPVKQIRAVGMGIAAMIDAFTGRGPAPVDRATQDEEMFI